MKKHKFKMNTFFRLGISIFVVLIGCALDSQGQTTLTNGSLVNGLSGSTSSERLYRLYVPSGQSKLQIRTYGGSGDADIYLRRNSSPTTSSYDHRSYSSGNTETITVNNPSSGDWYVKVRAYSAYSGLTLVATYTAPLAVVATPGINPGSMIATSPVSVTVNCATSGATIRYTTNGSDPTASSNIWPGSYTFGQSGTIKARAFKSGLADSAVASASYTISAPSVTTLSNNSPVAGLGGAQGAERIYRIYVPGGQTRLEVKSYGGSGDADLYLRRNSTPTTSSYDYRSYSNGNSETITVNSPSSGDWYVKVRAYSAYSGLTLVATYTAPIAVVATPVINPVSINTTSPVNVTVNCATSGATIRYTINGSDPTASSSIWPGAYTFSQSGTIKARAFKSGMADSAVASASYTISIPNPVSLPNNSPITGLNGGLGTERVYKIYVPSGQAKLEIRTYGGSGDADIYIRRNSVPTTSSYEYTGQNNGNTETITVNSPSSGDWYIKVRAYSAYSGLTLVATYTAPIAVVATPVINPVSMNTTSPVNVTMNCATIGATIRYTINGGDPTVNSNIWPGSYTFSQSGTIKARAFRSGMADSAVAIASYTIIAPSVTSLSNNAPFACYFSGAASQKVLKFAVPADTTPNMGVVKGPYSLEFALTGSGTCDIYVKKDSIPTSQAYDFRIYGAGATKSVLLDIDGKRFISGGEYYEKVNRAVSPGDWYVLLKSQGVSVSEITARYDEVALRRHSTQQSNGISNRKTWVLIHGRNDSFSSLIGSTVALENESPADQVLMLDWSSGATSPATVPFSEKNGRFMEAVAKKTKSLLATKGFMSGSSINIIGHSWGTYVGDWIKRKYGGVNHFIALDPANTVSIATNYVGTINFSQSSARSWSFLAQQGLAGSESLAKTASDAITVTFSPFTRGLNDTQIHKDVLTLFERILQENYEPAFSPTDEVSKCFRLDTVNSTSYPSWTRDRIGQDGAIKPILPIGDYSYEAHISCRMTFGFYPSFSGIESITYVNKSGQARRVAP